MYDTVVTETTFYPIKPTEKGLIGFASCLFGTLSLNSIAIYSTPEGDIRLLFPDKTLMNGKRLQCFYPINDETYQTIKVAIKHKIDAVMKRSVSTNGKYST